MTLWSSKRKSRQRLIMGTGRSPAASLCNKSSCDIKAAVKFYKPESCLKDCLCKLKWYCLILCATQNSGARPGGERWSRKHAGSGPHQHSQSVQGTWDRFPQCWWPNTRGEGFIYSFSSYDPILLLCCVGVWWLLWIYIAIQWFTIWYLSFIIILANDRL